MGEHGRGGRFSMRAGHGQRAAADAEPSEHLEIAQRGNAEFRGAAKFGIPGGTASL